MENLLNYYSVLLRRATGERQELEKLNSMYQTLSAGVIGEKRVLYSLKELDFPHLILHNFTSRNLAGNPVQIDIILICKHFVFILEVKNITGRIDFDDKRRQFIRTQLDGRVESFMNPVDQVIRHKQLLENIFIESPDFIPIEAAVVIANHSTVIGRISSEVPIFNVSGLRHVVNELKKKYEHISLNMRKVQQLLMSKYIERPFVRPTFNVTIRAGVLCADCNEVMPHITRGFKCLRCGKYDVDDQYLRQALSDYCVLYRKTISNADFRRWVGVREPRTASRILKRLCLPMKGKSRATYYSLESIKLK